MLPGIERPNILKIISPKSGAGLVMLRACLTLCSICWALCDAKAQADSTGTVAHPYIENYADFILLRGGVKNRSLNFNLSPRSNGITEYGKIIFYRPNVRNTIGINALFKHFGLGFGFKLNNDPLAGNTQSQYSDFRVHSYGAKLGYDIFYQQYKGYFISNLDFNDPIGGLVTGEGRPRRDDLRLQNLTLNVFYNSKPDKFSYRAAYVFDEKQKKSAGAFIINGSLGYFRAVGDSSFVPSDNSFGFDQRSYFNNTAFYTLSISPGYALTLVFWKHFYLSAAASGMVGLQYYDAIGEQIGENRFHYYFKGLARASAGYNSRRWLFGATALADVQNLNTQYIQYRTINFELSLHLAYRIKTNWMKDQRTFFGFLKKKK